MTRPPSTGRRSRTSSDPPSSHQTPGSRSLPASSPRLAPPLRPSTALSSPTDTAVDAPGLPLDFSRSYDPNLAQRYAISPLGRGWTDNWQASIQQSPDGSVRVTGPGRSLRDFQPDSRNS